MVNVHNQGSPQQSSLTLLTIILQQWKGEKYGTSYPRLQIQGKFWKEKRRRFTWCIHCTDQLISGYLQMMSVLNAIPVHPNYFQYITITPKSQVGVRKSGGSPKFHHKDHLDYVPYQTPTYNHFFQMNCELSFGFFFRTQRHPKRQWPRNKTGWPQNTSSFLWHVLWQKQGKSNN